MKKALDSRLRGNDGKTVGMTPFFHVTLDYSLHNGYLMITYNRKVVMRDKYLSTIEAAKIMGISRVAVLKQIKSGKLRAERVGRNYIIDRADLAGIFKGITPSEKRKVSNAMKKVVKEYGPALKRLGKE